MKFFFNFYVLSIINKLLSCQDNDEDKISCSINILDYKYELKTHQQTKSGVKDKEEKILYILKKELSRLIRYNNSLILNFEFLEYNAKDNHQYAKDISKEHFLYSFNNSMENILYITKSFKKIFIKENKWIFSNKLRKLDIFLNDTDQNKKYKYIEETEEYLKKYDKTINDLYKISILAEKIYSADYKFLDRSLFEYILLFLEQFVKAVRPSKQILNSSRRCCKYYNILDKTKYKKKKPLSYLYHILLERYLPRIINEI